MDAPSLPPEFSRELHALRRRAYGLDADIERDPSALRRLSELEAGTRGLVAADEPDELSDPKRHRARQHPESPRSPRRRTTVIAAAAAATLWAASTLWTPHSDAVLARTDSTQQERQDLIDTVDLTALDMVGARLQSFAAFRELSVWAADSPSGTTCLIVGSEPRGFAQVGCAPDPLQPWLDLHVGEQVGAELVGGLPPRSVVRFALHGQRVEVWIAESTARAVEDRSGAR